MHSFASDNYAGAHPEVIEAVIAANTGHARPYGADPTTARAVEAVREALGAPGAEVAFVFNGTGANVVSLQLGLGRWHHVVCASSAHINVDECGAPERFTGAKLLDVPTPDGKLTPDLIRGTLARLDDEHVTQPGMVSISQTTEYGTVYTPAEVRALADTAHELGMYLHLDGARIANAAAALGVGLAETTSSAGVDVVSFGGTKNGLLGAEAVVVLADALKPSLRFVRKQSGQLGSKGRFLAAQFLALLTDDLWRRNALHANGMARRLYQGVRDLDGVTVTQVPQANVVFAILPGVAVEPLQAVAPFYVWNETTGEVRWMCSWDTTAEQVDEFVEAVAKVVVRQ